METRITSAIWYDTEFIRSTDSGVHHEFFARGMGRPMICPGGNEIPKNSSHTNVCNYISEEIHEMGGKVIIRNIKMEFIDGFGPDIDLILKHADFQLWTDRADYREGIPTTFLKPVFIKDFTVDEDTLSSFQFGDKGQWFTPPGSPTPPAPANLRMVKQPLYDTMGAPTPAIPGECINDFLKWVADKKLKGEPITAFDVKKLLHIHHIIGGFELEEPFVVGHTENLVGSVRMAKDAGLLKGAVYVRIILEGEVEHLVPF